MLKPQNDIHQREEIEQFYERALGYVPEQLSNNGHFNVFRLEPYIGANAKPVPYVRRNYYKVMMVEGQGIVSYADRTVEVNGVALSFSNPNIPYKWNTTDLISRGCFCIFNDAFFKDFGDLSSYEVFHPQGQHIFHLDKENQAKVETIYDEIFNEIDTDYEHKYDLFRMKIFELVHLAQRINPENKLAPSRSDASERITNLFLELLERQFPIDEDHRTIKFRAPSAYAQQLNIHVNHLNKSIKAITNKTTSQVIAERIIHEAKRLLKDSSWSVADVAFGLGFKETSHFNNFFKKWMNTTPLQYRKGI